MNGWWLIALIALTAPVSAAEALSQNTDPIREAVLDYARSHQEGSPDLIKSVLHSNAVKGIVGSDVEGATFVIHEDFEKIVAGVRRPRGPEREQQQIQILDVTGDTASVKVTMGDVVHHLHLVKTERVVQAAQESAGIRQSQPPTVVQSWRIVHILAVMNR